MQIGFTFSLLKKTNIGLIFYGVIYLSINYILHNVIYSNSLNNLSPHFFLNNNADRLCTCLGMVLLFCLFYSGGPALPYLGTMIMSGFTVQSSPFISGLSQKDIFKTIISQDKSFSPLVLISYFI